MNRYTYRAQWCPDNDEYVAKCLEFPYLRERAPTAQQAVALVVAALDEKLAIMQELGEHPPPSLTDRNYSGTFIVRTSTALHLRLALEAQEEGVSMNQWVVQQLTGRRRGEPAYPWD
ncbi:MULTISPECIES: type II toxin-antitoxin system HicB family antitoxin [Mycobacterium]|uniref:Antitoxin HicB n=1 Tax=Mycobacterium kiyosense TaxID=2871094 RepID=A0A9P3Q556_9MYCO|nr:MULTISPECIES: type II toxin-antitoxin system HicB family antitoxin [Mycobacterium]BDB45300.1 antitoxin HicB [Mycobacterium kiyosense]BDE16767.1 antitoxin HicB [Mycobacterium sp. 20KCMC460]GLB85469.1 antitoxin HicB [Mycobacterium kiyosense]GLB90524.1 antitoxin HicB [Mycobacterium kiyosense]GLB96260.1 antitoxin HicB [Mycobacterium kiyosense]